MLRFLRHILRICSYLFLALAALAALGLSAVIVASPHDQVHLGWLPWDGETLGAALAVIGLVGLIFVFLAVIGRARILLTLFALFCLVLVARGLFFSSWRFSGEDQFHNGLHLTLALFLAFLGTIPMGKPKGSNYRA